MFFYCYITASAQRCREFHGIQRIPEIHGSYKIHNIAEINRLPIAVALCCWLAEKYPITKSHENEANPIQS